MPHTSNTKRQSLRLYLIKKTITKYADALRDDVTLDSYDLKHGLGLTGKFYLRPAHPLPVDWYDFVQSGIRQTLPHITSTPNAAVLFLTIDGRILALVFGTGRYLLKDTAYEADFGLLSTLNVVDPGTLRSIDVHSFQDMVVQKRVQTSRSTNLAAFEVDVTRERFRAVTGSAKDTALGGRVSGSEGGFGVAVAVEFKDLEEQCKKYMNAYSSKVYQAAFPRTDDLNVVNDPALEMQLDATVVSRLRKKQTADIYLSPPELIDFNDFSGFSFSEKGAIADELLIDSYLVSRSDLSSLDLDALKRHRVFLRLEAHPEPLAKWSIYRSLICEIKKGKNVYVLSNGQWHRVSAAFADRVSDYLNTIHNSTLALPSPTANIKEADYLAEASASSPDLALMDQKFVWCDNAGSQIEVCDLFSIERHLVHAKRKKYGAMGYSHLFMQGRNSAEALVRDESFRQGARNHLASVGAKFAKKVPKQQPKAGQFEVVFALMGTSTPTYVESLPFFSRLTLMHVAQDLRALGIDVSLKQIESPE